MNLIHPYRRAAGVAAGTCSGMVGATSESDVGALTSVFGVAAGISATEISTAGLAAGDIETAVGAAVVVVVKARTLVVLGRDGKVVLTEGADLLDPAAVLAATRRRRSAIRSSTDAFWAEGAMAGDRFLS